jgi:exopolysaccharide biosynthesis polyprenyl glycosylphosphotransferase
VIGVSLAVRGVVPDETSYLVHWRVVGVAMLAAVVAAVLRHAMKQSKYRDQMDFASVVPRAAIASAVAVLLTATAGWLYNPNAMSGDKLAWWTATWVVASSAASAAIWLGAALAADAARIGARVVLTGPSDETVSMSKALTCERRSFWNLVGRTDDREPDGLQRLEALVKTNTADIVVIMGEGAARIAAICELLADQPVRVYLSLDSASLEHAPASCPRVGNYALFDIACDPLSGGPGTAKRAIDIVISLAAILALAPAFALVALAIKLEDAGPVIFRQKRFGLGGRPITVYKFRTMRSEQCDATGEQRTLAQDPRVTRLGRILRRTSIDELPQLLSVLRGDMSLVGPRPHPLHMRVAGTYYHEAVRHYRARHVVRPGITGWAQVNGSRGEIDTLEKARRRVELDLWYLEHWSLVLDLRILVRTALGGFLSRGAD